MDAKKNNKKNSLYGGRHDKQKETENISAQEYVKFLTSISKKKKLGQIKIISNLA